jgi:hypothetical protein
VAVGADDGAAVGAAVGAIVDPQHLNVSVSPL